MTYILCPNVLVTHSWGWIGECQSLSIRRWVMHTAPLGLQLLRDPPQSGLGLQRPSYRGVPSCVQGALRESCLWRGYVPEGWDLHASAHFFTMAGYPAAIAESEMYISQLLFTIALDTSHKLNYLCQVLGTKNARNNDLATNMFHITISCIYLFLTPNSRSVVRAGVSLNIHSFIRFMFTMMCFMFMIWNPAVFKHCRLQLYLIGLYIICICYREVFITCASQSK